MSYFKPDKLGHLSTGHRELLSCAFAFEEQQLEEQFSFYFAVIHLTLFQPSYYFSCPLRGTKACLLLSVPLNEVLKRAENVQMFLPDQIWPT